MWGSFRGYLELREVCLGGDNTALPVPDPRTAQSPQHCPGSEGSAHLALLSASTHSWHCSSVAHSKQYFLSGSSMKPARDKEKAPGRSWQSCCCSPASARPQLAALLTKMSWD